MAGEVRQGRENKDMSVVRTLSSRSVMLIRTTLCFMHPNGINNLQPCHVPSAHSAQ